MLQAQLNPAPKVRKIRFKCSKPTPFPKFSDLSTARQEILNKQGSSRCDRPAADPTYFQTYERFEALKRAVPDPTTLILVDEADRLQMNSVEMIRSIFDKGHSGMVLIGMPGIEMQKRAKGR
jgi:AAA domain